MVQEKESLNRLHINMLSQANSVPGQGVGSAYIELINLLKKYYKNDLNITVNEWRKSDITHYHTVNPSYYLSTFFPNRGVKIGYVHFLPETLKGSLKLPKLFRFIFNKYLISFYKRMDKLVVVNPDFIDKLTSYNISKDKIKYIPNFVSKKEFFPINAEQKDQLKIKFKYDKNDFIVLGVGQVQERKGVSDFVDLAKQLPGFKFIWVGGFSFGKMTDGYSELKSVVDDPPQNLIFPGIVSRKQIRLYYQMADVFLLPSYNELFPMSVLEASSCEIPLLLRNLSLYENILGDHYLSANNIDGFQKQLRLLNSDKKMIKKMQMESLKLSKQYSEEKLAKIWFDFYSNEYKLNL